MTSRCGPLVAVRARVQENIHLSRYADDTRAYMFKLAVMSALLTKLFTLSSTNFKTGQNFLQTEVLLLHHAGPEAAVLPRNQIVILSLQF